MGGKHLRVAFLVMLGVVLAGAAGAMAPPAGVPEIHAQGEFSLYLPAVFRGHDPSWVPPFGVTMYGAVDEART